VSFNGKDRLGLVPDGSYQNTRNRMMNPTHDAFDVDGKGVNMDSPEEISFPYKLREIKLHLPRHKIGKESENTDSREEISFSYKLRQIKLYLDRHKIDYQTRYHKIVNDTIAASNKKLR
jgi:hypothetical protein